MGGVTGGVRLPLACRGGGMLRLLRDRPPQPKERDSLGWGFFLTVWCSRHAASVMNLLT